MTQINNQIQVSKSLEEKGILKVTNFVNRGLILHDLIVVSDTDARVYLKTEEEGDYPEFVIGALDKNIRKLDSITGTNICFPQNYNIFIENYKDGITNIFANFTPTDISIHVSVRQENLKIMEGDTNEG